MKSWKELNNRCKSNKRANGADWAEGIFSQHTITEQASNEAPQKAPLCSPSYFLPYSKKKVRGAVMRSPMEICCILPDLRLRLSSLPEAEAQTQDPHLNKNSPPVCSTLQPEGCHAYLVQRAEGGINGDQKIFPNSSPVLNSGSLSVFWSGWGGGAF